MTDFMNERKDVAPLLDINIWPNRSMSRENFGLFVILLGILAFWPVVPFFGSKTLIAILPFSLSIALLLLLLRRYADNFEKIHETLVIWPNLITVRRYESNGSIKEWNSNPYWTKVNLYENSEKIENYLTLSGSGREIELGAFLAPGERLELKNKIELVIAKI